MSQRGSLSDAYIAGLQHDLVDVPGDARFVGVIRRPPPWAWPHLDENHRALGPPDELLDDFRDREAELLDEGMDDERAHNAAWDDVDYPRRYRAYLDASEAAGDAIAAIRDRLDDGDNVVLVCFENTESKHCHRTILIEYLDDSQE